MSMELAHYPFRVKPYAHQLEAWQRSKDEYNYALFMEMGTGKTKVALDTAAYLYDKGEINRLIVFANKGSYLNWVTEEIPKHMPAHLAYQVVAWTSDPTKVQREELESLMGFHPSVLKIFVVNTEALAHDKGRAASMRYVMLGECMAIVDESTMIKNLSAKRTEAAIRIGRRAKYRRILTGSPITKSPLDLYAQCEFLSSKCLGFGSYYTFRNHFANLVNMTAGQRAFKKVAGYRNLDELQEILQGFSFRVTKEECLDLPPKVYQQRDVELTKSQKELYEQLRKTAVAELEQGVVTAPLVITRLLRLHQVVCGHLVDDEGVLHEVENHRLQAMMDVIEEGSETVIIWANYRHDIQSIAAALSKEYGADTVATYYGDTTRDERAEAVQDLQAGRKRFFVGNQRTGGYGITLTAASTVIYYSNSYDLELRLQSEDRAHRIGQTKRVTYVDLVARRTVDEKILKALRQKRQLAAEVLGDEWRDLFAPEAA